ncbi:MAG: type II CAAX endopeptidase family protein [Bacteroidales bacterium]
MSNEKDDRSEEFPKGWLRPILILLPYLFLVGAMQLICSLLLGIDPTVRNPLLSPLENVWMSAFTLVGGLVVVWIFRFGVDKRDFRSMGFQMKHMVRDLAYGAIAGLLIVGLGFVVLLLWKQVQVEQMTYDGLDLLFCFLMFVAAAIGEEVFFRGYVLNNLLLSFKPWLALVISSVFFSVFHGWNAGFSWIPLVSLFLAGILLGLPLIFTKRLWLSIAMHFSWNFTQGPIFGFHVSGHQLYSVLEHTESPGNTWNGGMFGFEGSLVSIFVLLLAISGYLWCHRSLIHSKVTES